MRVVTGPGLTRMKQAYKMEKRGEGDSSRCMLCVKAGLKGAENSNTKRINNDFVRAYQKKPASDTTANTVKRGSSPS